MAIKKNKIFPLGYASSFPHCTFVSGYLITLWKIVKDKLQLLRRLLLTSLKCTFLGGNGFSIWKEFEFLKLIWVLYIVFFFFLISFCLWSCSVSHDGTLRWRLREKARLELKRVETSFSVLFRQLSLCVSDEAKLMVSQKGLALWWFLFCSVSWLVVPNF